LLQKSYDFSSPPYTIENNINKEVFMENDVLNQEVKAENPMKEWLVTYVGTKMQPEDGGVTVNMIVNAMADEFPEFLLAIAEENFIRGYEQALYDVDHGVLKQETNESN
jgi:hypothetical protein